MIVAETKVSENSSKSPTKLQWGRDLIVAETVRLLFAAISTESLQWGRDLIVAETTTTPQRIRLDSSASMGPRLDSRGNLGAAVAPALTEAAASMGPRLDSRGNKHGIIELVKKADGFNGAAT